MKKSLLVLTALMAQGAQAKDAPATCDRIAVHALGWLATTSFSMAPDDVRQLEERAFVTKDAAEIAIIMTMLQKKMSEPAAKDPAERLDTRLVVDCFKSEGHVETFAASGFELRQPPNGKTVAIDEKFRKFFTIDKDFAKRLKQ